MLPTESLPDKFSFFDRFEALRAFPTTTINQILVNKGTLTPIDETASQFDFKGILVVNGLFGDVLWLLSDTLLLSGRIEVQTVNGMSFPIIRLNAPLITPLNLGIFDLAFSIRIGTSLQLFKGQDPGFLYNSQVALVTEFRTESLTLPMVMPIYGPNQGLFSFYLDLTKPVPAIKDLSSISGFTGKKDPKSLITVDLPWEGASFSLDSAGVIFDSRSKSLVNIEIGVSFNLSWTIIKDVLELQRVGGVFSIEDPAKPQLENVSVMLFAELKVGPVFLETSIQLPEKILHAGLQEGTTVDINDLIGTFAKGVKLPGTDTLVIDTLDFYAQIGSDPQYSFEAGISGQLTIVEGLAIESILFLVAYENKALSEVRLGCQLGLTKCAVDLFLQAVYQKDNGWQFSGSSGPGQEIPVGHFIEDIVNMFRVRPENSSPLPDFITGLIVQDILIEFNTNTKNFDFNLTIKEDTSPNIRFTFGVHLENTANGFVLKFEALVAHPKFDVEFDLTITESTSSTQPPEKTSEVLGEYKTTRPPKLSDLIEAIARYNQMNAGLPAELNIDAAATGFAIAVKRVGKNPTLTELAGAFNVKFGNNDLDLYFAYTNEVAPDAAFKQPMLVNGKPAYVFGASFGGVLDLSKLPVVGSMPGMNEFAIDKLGFFYTNAVLDASQQAHFRVPQITGSKKLAPDATGSVLEKGGFNLVAVFGKKGTDAKAPISPMGTLSIPLGGGAVRSAQDPAFDKAPAKTEAPIHWLALNKTIGPVSLQKVGLNYSKGEATIGFSGGITLAGFMLDLQELAITFPMPLPGSPAGTTVGFDLKGMAIDIKKGGFELGGAFLRSQTASGQPAYYGQIIVHIGSFGLLALGGYAPPYQELPASFFIYASVEIPLGGPPYLYITGFAGGFGVNNLLKLPTLETLPDFILLPGHNAPKQGTSAESTMSAVLPKMQEYFIPKSGQYWIAAGINFSTFEMIQSFALVTVSFGVDFEIALLGSCSMSFPTRVPNPVAYIEIDIMASFSTATGLLAVQGIIAPTSYIFGDFCKITGGFAFYIWFNPPPRAKGPKAGEFLVTIGGYHPAFVPPPYYPKVPRVGITFNLGPLRVTGGAYFALTSGMFMIGGFLDATFDIKIVKVWFSVGANFLIGWAPFHYEADIYVRLGCAINLGIFTINISIGADLTLWGPPLGGIAHVDLEILTITISFGAERLPPPPIDWDDFKTKFLPADAAAQPASRAARRSVRAATAANATNIVKSSVSTGLQNTEVNGLDWILDSDHFVIVVGSAIPVNQPFWGNKPILNDRVLFNADPPPVDKDAWPYLIFTDERNGMGNGMVWNPTLNIKPMGRNNVTSELRLQLLKKNNEGQYADAVIALTLEPLVADSAAALWDQHTETRLKANDNAVVKSCLTGFKITPLPRIPNTVKEVVLIQLLYQQGNDYYFNDQRPITDERYTVSAVDDGIETLNIEIGGNHTAALENKGYVLQSLTDDWVTEQRNAILQNLRAVGFSTFEAVNLETFAAKTALTDWPEVLLLGDAF